MDKVEVDRKVHGITLEELEKRWEEEKTYRANNPTYDFFLSIQEFFTRLPDRLNDWKYEIIYAWDRVFRGFDDRMIFSFHYEHADLCLKVLKILRDDKHGSPVVLDAVDWEEWGHGENEELSDKNHKMWIEIMDKMIAGFEAQLALDEVYILGKDGNYDHAASQIERERLNKIWEEGMGLFIKHYGALWD